MRHLILDDCPKGGVHDIGVMEGATAPLAYCRKCGDSWSVEDAVEVDDDVRMEQDNDYIAERMAEEYDEGD